MAKYHIPFYGHFDFHIQLIQNMVMLHIESKRNELYDYIHEEALPIHEHLTLEWGSKQFSSENAHAAY